MNERRVWSSSTISSNSILSSAVGVRSFRRAPDDYEVNLAVFLKASVLC